ncbi:Fe(3+)-siderophore ABC transporter permease [Cronobacter sakazakii]|uniref:Fe(3+)-siderophore ABC transporter permease n=4 Tax=Cronobacter TaxID=413496 RepID=UPI001639CAFC|nr:Fe(3+)-siderophore ABC transporter permease [Cronobacter sakazakii]
MSASRLSSRMVVLLCLLLLLLLMAALSLRVGAKSLPFSLVMDALTGTCREADCTIVLDARLPRTLAGIVAGLSLGLAGALMQTLTRNPLADPGLLGVNAGASFAIVLGAALWGVNDPLPVLALALCGALAATLIVAFTGSAGGGQLSPVRLTLAGVALAAVLEGLSGGIALLNPTVYDQLRFWQAGSLDIRTLTTLKAIAPLVLTGAVIALLLGRALNSLSMGADTATALGSRVARMQVLGLVAITLLCASATAVVGPIAFIGLMMPHLARWLVGADHRWSLPVTLLATPSLLLLADIIGRLVVPGELRVSVVSAFIGAPALIYLVRQRRGGDLSGGQQQQLAIGRALASRPQLLILDEPTEGIQPSVIKEIGDVIRALAARGDMAILLVEQFYDFAAGLADNYLVMSRGAIVQRGPGAAMEADGVRGLVAI